MGNSRNDYHRNKYRDWDDDYSDNPRERNKHRKEKRLINALRSRNVDALYEEDE